MALSYLQVQFDELNLKSIQKRDVKACIELGFRNAVSNLKSKRLKLLKKKKPKNLTNVSPEPPKKPSVMDSKTRAQYYEEHNSKAAESKELAKRLTEERKLREKREQERLQKQLAKIQEEEELQKELEEQKALEKEQQRQKRLQEMQEKSKLRKNEIKELKHIGNREYKKVVSNKPLYKQIEETYEQEVMMPELQKKKEELAKRRNMFQPVRQTEIAERAKKLDEMKSEQEKQKLKEFRQRKLVEMLYIQSYKASSKFQESIRKEIKRHESQKKTEQSKKLELVSRKKMYSNLVKEIYTPKVDPYKRNELELMKEKLKNPTVSIRSRSTNPSKSHNNSLERINHTKKWKKNTMIPDPPPKKEPKIIDYLAEKRKQRESKTPHPSIKKQFDWEKYLKDPNLDQEELLKTIMEKAGSIEKEALKYEKNIGAIDPQNLSGLEFSDQVSGLLIDSIKAKIAVIENS